MICLTDSISSPSRPCKMILTDSANIKGALSLIKEPLMSIQGAFVLQLVGSQPVAMQLWSSLMLKWFKSVVEKSDGRPIALDCAGKGMDCLCNRNVIFFGLSLKGGKGKKKGKKKRTMYFVSCICQPGDQ